MTAWEMHLESASLQGLEKGNTEKPCFIKNVSVVFWKLPGLSETPMCLTRNKRLEHCCNEAARSLRHTNCSLGQSVYKLGFRA